jgi:hypothetical protein
VIRGEIIDSIIARVVSAVKNVINNRSGLSSIHAMQRKDSNWTIWVGFSLFLNCLRNIDYSESDLSELSL